LTPTPTPPPPSPTPPPPTGRFHAESFQSDGRARSRVSLQLGPDARAIRLWLAPSQARSRNPRKAANTPSTPDAASPLNYKMDTGQQYLNTALTRYSWYDRNQDCGVKPSSRWADRGPQQPWGAVSCSIAGSVDASPGRSVRCGAGIRVMAECQCVYSLAMNALLPRCRSGVANRVTARL